MAEQDRTARAQTTREGEQRAPWRPASLLPDPNPVPGYGFRWVRASTLGENDPTNVSAKFREGWEPVKATDHPELAIAGNKSGMVEVGGLILCKAPVETLAQRDAYYKDRAVNQIRSVDNDFMRESDARMPLFSERRSEVSRFGDGT
ncbi:MAG TPA: hypothetical protein PKL84_00300 [Candidatus Hydrogenedentes bacterium]|nr:hypothetical protein [Candidatus Hydrogenedentota bacterium]